MNAELTKARLLAERCQRAAEVKKAFPQAPFKGNECVGSKPAKPVRRVCVLFDETSSPHVAVSGGHRTVRVDQGAAADVLPRLNGHDVLDGMRNGGVASHDMFLACNTHLHTHR